jgi:tetratricopeptide (TPR) repeat protein
MGTMRNTFASLGSNTMTVFFCILILSMFNVQMCNAKSLASAQRSKEPQNESDIIPHPNDWREASLRADKLIDEKKYGDAENMLIGILPRAKIEAPQSVDYALTLCRLSTALYLLKKYPQALQRVQEATTILDHKPASKRQRKVAWRIMLVKIAICLGMGNNAEAEALARKSIAYAIAFPDVAGPSQLKTAYSLLYDSLTKQKKLEEAKKVREIMNRL